MLSALNAHQSGATELERLLEDLDELLLMLSDDNSEWKQRFNDTRKMFAKNPKKATREMNKLLEGEIKHREREHPNG